MNKICTSLEQSKKLSEFLTVESADMCYIKDKPKIGFLYEEYKEFGDTILQDYYPCWSLAALLGVLPDKIHLDNETYHLNFSKDEVKYLGYITWDGQKCISTKSNTIVDACYEMIIVLHERKLL